MTFETPWGYAIWLIPIAALGVALADMPYGYYQLLRVLVFCACCYLAFRSHESKLQAWTWLFAGLAITYNPIVKLHLGAEVWPIVNVATILVLAFHLYRSRRLANG